MRHHHTWGAKKKIKRLRAKPSMPSLFFLSDDVRVKNPLEVIAGLPHNCGIIIRDYKNLNRETLIKTVIKSTKNTKHRLFISNIDRYGCCNAELGEHWPQAGRASQRKKHRHQLITSSAHNLSEVGRANRLNVDGVLVSPLFSTPSHPNSKALNIHRFVRLARLAKPYVYALGGVNRKSMRRIGDKMPIFGIAGIGLFKK